MSLEYIRKTYNVPAKRGGMIRYVATDGEEITGRITGSRGARLLARMERYDGTFNRKSSTFHPTWNITYLANTSICHPVDDKKP